MNGEKEKQAIDLVVACLRANAPIETGNLSRNAIGFGQEGDTWYAWVGGEIADYAVYTNEPWTSEKWHGAQNPNEGWIDRAINEALPLIRNLFDGELTDDEYNDFISGKEQQFQSNDDRIRGGLGGEQ